MADIIKLDEFRAEKDVVIEIERSEEFYEAARALNECLKKLPLPNSQHNELVKLILNQVEAAERSGCEYGLRMGIEFALAENSTQKK